MRLSTIVTLSIAAFMLVGAAPNPVSIDARRKMATETVLSFEHVHEQESGYDHAALSFCIDTDDAELAQARLLAPDQISQPKQRAQNNTQVESKVALPTETYMDRLLVKTLESGNDPNKKLEKLFGPVLHQTAPIMLVYTVAARIRDWQQLWHMQALSLVLMPVETVESCFLVTPHYLEQIYTRLDHTLHIWTRSESVVKSIVYHAERNDLCGWNVPNGELLRKVLACIRRRTAPLILEFLPGERSNSRIDGTMKLAATATCSLNLVAQTTSSNDVTLLSIPFLPKVSARNIHGLAYTVDVGVVSILIPHRGREKLPMIKKANYAAIAGAKSVNQF
ncbi:hypothetical protein C8J56DRAFT_900013 [Mycena floridula]|nr:hypothetical protein C8J56DRAFT_900013 [Mycena floridula]